MPELNLRAIKGSDSILKFATESYGERPIVIQGAGAGASVTARGVLEIYCVWQIKVTNHYYLTCELFFIACGLFFIKTNLKYMKITLKELKDYHFLLQNRRGHKVYLDNQS